MAGNLALIVVNAINLLFYVNIFWRRQWAAGIALGVAALPHPEDFFSRRFIENVKSIGKIPGRAMLTQIASEAAQDCRKRERK